MIVSINDVTGSVIEPIVDWEIVTVIPGTKVDPLTSTLIVIGFC